MIIATETESEGESKIVSCHQNQQWKGDLPVGTFVLGTTKRGYPSLWKFPLTSLSVYCTGSEWKSFQWDTDGKKERDLIPHKKWPMN